MYLRILLAAAVAVAVSPASAQTEEKLDRVFSNMDSVYPTFVAARSVLTAEGDVDPTLFSPQDAGIITRRLAKNREGCLQILASPTCGIVETGKPVSNDLASFVGSSERVFAGKILSVTPGFLRFDPGSLLEVAVGQMLKGEAQGFDSYYVFFEAGTFQVGHTEFCATAPQHTRFPEIGDDVLVIVQHHDWNNRFLFIEPDRGFFSFENGEVSLPKYVVSADPQLRHLSKRGFTDFVTSVISGSEQGSGAEGP